MTFNLHAELPVLMPKAIAWAEEQCEHILRVGCRLDDYQDSLARRVGVSSPERIRVLEVESLPLPEDSSLKQVAIATGLLGPDMIGLTLGHGIFVCRGRTTVRLLSHEFRHVYQYEQAGSIADFLPLYLEQIATVGYDGAPFEVDAKAHERQRV